MKRPHTVAAALGAAVLAGVPLALAGPANAQPPPSVVWLEGNQLRFYDTANTKNVVRLESTGRTFRVIDSAPGADLAAQAPCVPVNAYTVDCPANAVASYSFDLRAGHDTAVNTTAASGSMYGGAGADYLIGGSQVDILSGGAENDRLMGRLGNDRLYGGPGLGDWAAYNDRTAANQHVTVRLDNNVADDGQPGINEKDLVSQDVENVDGGAGNDTLVGSGASNWLNGANGTDRLYGMVANDRLTPGPGKDFVYGGPGAYDYIDYTTRTNPVRVTLHDGVANEGEVNEGDYADGAVEAVLGGQGADYLVGNAVANSIQGNAGDDQLYGLAGNDALAGHAGNDRMFGREGSDILQGHLGFDRADGGPQNDNCSAEVIVNCP